MTEKKTTATALEGTGDSVSELREQVAELRGRILGLTAGRDSQEDLSEDAVYGRHFPGVRAEENWRRSKDVEAAKVALQSDSADHYTKGALPTKRGLFIHAPTRTAMAWIAVLGKKGWKLVDHGPLPWLPAGESVGLMHHPDEKTRLIRQALGGQPVGLQDAVVRFSRGELPGPHDAYSHARVADLYNSIMKMNPVAAQAIYVELTLPTMRLIGQLLNQVRPQCSYFVEMNEGDPIPEEFKRLMALSESTAPVEGERVGAAADRVG